MDKLVLRIMVIFIVALVAFLGKRRNKNPIAMSRASTEPPKQRYASQRTIIVLIFICALAGGFVGEQLFGTKVVRDATNSLYQHNNREHAFFRDDEGRARMDMGMYSGQPMHSFWSKDSAIRLQLATYANDIRADEKGLPVVALFNRAGSIKEFFRLDGANQSPLLIVKDNANHEKILMGLSLRGADEDPFFCYFDKDGKQHDIFGHFHF